MSNLPDRVALVRHATKIADEALMYVLPQIKETIIPPLLVVCNDLLLDIVFVPRVILRQLAVAIALHSGAVTLQQMIRLAKICSSYMSSRMQEIRGLRAKHMLVNNQQEWLDIALRIDELEGNDVWRINQECQLYESDRIIARIDEIKHLMRRGDIFDLMFTLRGGLTRNQFGLLHEGLFSKAMAGTKVLVENFHATCCAGLDFVCDMPVVEGEEPIPTDTRLAFFNEARHAYGRTALLLSGGAALGFYHVGVVKAFIDNHVMPRVISGASAGSIVCAMIGTRTNEECLADLFNSRGTNSVGHSGVLALDFFRPVGYKKEEGEGGGEDVVLKSDHKRTWQLLFPIGVRRFSSFIYDLLTGGVRAKDIFLNDTDHFSRCCKTNIGNFTFQEAFDRTGRILNIAVSPQNRSDPPRLLNYLTAPHVLVWSAAVASASLPGIFEASRLLVKDSDGTERYESSTASRFQDGSMESDLPMDQLSEMFNVNHFIISQVNPHACMLASFSLSKSIWSNAFVGVVNGILQFLKKQIKGWIRNFIELVGGRRIAPLWDTRRGFFVQLLTQEYEGRDCDVTLNPWENDISLFKSFFRCIYNPTDKEFFDWMKAAERETWKYIPMVRNHCAVEVTLDCCVQRLRKQIMNESQAWQSQQKLGETNGTSLGGNRTNGTSLGGNRMPSFYTSPSLINLGGLAIGDQYHRSTDLAMPDSAPLSSFHSNQNLQYPNLGRSFPSQNGFGSGVGLSDGLYMDDTDDEASHTFEVFRSAQIPRRVHRAKSIDSGDGGPLPGDSAYTKTTNMTAFYYRKNKSHESLGMASDKIN
eukprot:CAMPEP_0113297802 /NCGR_PEP_ID=MMETSP0010_2-20120614/510_1 /TAXON_ID=216773 ORGANISM="Corethron hystrix, Strain 308" /NCGR_SAMPLE_ID=MMETSP0010_2 /ASSEMBLY_ACC=CAM_ASM_000155 /LENGTH=812 /DNA_ID=CAMNT_0000150747 /DNA_START=197 /DNA_END=2636 /DNA_ORIENTATION=- /assembly_acc=CAM_ASM_000155